MLYVFRLWLRDLVLNAKKPAKSRRVDRRTRPGGLTLESLEPLIMPAFGQLPIAFEANQGQADSQVEAYNADRVRRLVLRGWAKLNAPTPDWAKARSDFDAAIRFAPDNA